MAKTIEVKGVRKASDIDGQKGNPTILWEKDPAHPDGEVFIADDGNTYTVGETAAIKRLLHEGRLVKVEAAARSPLGYGGKKPDKDEQPWAGYDDADEAAIVERLRAMQPAERNKALAYERKNKNRPGILDVNWNS